jgi:hypothetical protein
MPVFRLAPKIFLKTRSCQAVVPMPKCGGLGGGVHGFLTQMLNVFAGQAGHFDNRIDGHV